MIIMMIQMMKIVMRMAPMMSKMLLISKKNGRFLI